LSKKKRFVLTVCTLVAAGTPSFAADQGFTKCTVGQPVMDSEGKTGIVVSTDNHLCQVKYPDGQVYGWIYWNLRPANTPATSLPQADPPGQGAPLPTILKAGPAVRTLVYRTDQRGHVALTAIVNGAPVRFIVDTGATRVTLTAADARAAGIDPGGLVFNQRSQTANGLAREAPVTLREVRIDRLSIDNVSAAVNENLTVSLLGMSFLKRLKSFEMRDGSLTISW
jgi:clan AA aspartic protease (TIGR02281 family)